MTLYKIKTNFNNKSIKISKPSIPAVFIELMLKKIILEQFFELISQFSSVSCDCYITEVVCFQNNPINSSRPSEFKKYETVSKCSKIDYWWTIDHFQLQTLKILFKIIVPEWTELNSKVQMWHIDWQMFTPTTSMRSISKLKQYFSVKSYLW